MVISLRRFIKPMAGVAVLFTIAVILWVIFSNNKEQLIMGAFIHTNNHENEYSQTVFSANDQDYSERFHRPSKQPALKLKYSFKDFENGSEQPPYIKIVFKEPEDVIQAYYAILKEASNMLGYSGGCGTIGLAKIPYPYAYELLSKETRQQISYEKFEESFAGIGHTTLLKLLPAYSPPDTPKNIKYYMVEIEVITGPPFKEGGRAQPSYFAYYYGLITTAYTPSEGWKIKSIDYIPEDFLCAPYHHWDWDARALVEIIYKGWYNLASTVEKVEKEDSLIYVYAAGGKNKYRFDFVRLTNGEDLLLHENILENGKWKEVNLLKDEHQIYKFSILNPNLRLKK